MRPVKTDAKLIGFGIPKGFGTPFAEIVGTAKDKEVKYTVRLT